MKSSFLLFTSPFLSFLLVLPCRLLRESLILELGPVQGEFNHYKAHSFRGRDKQGIFKHSKNDFILWVSLSPHILESPFVEFIRQRTTKLLWKCSLNELDYASTENSSSAGKYQAWTFEWTFFFNLGALETQCAGKYQAGHVWWFIHSINMPPTPHSHTHGSFERFYFGHKTLIEPAASNIKHTNEIVFSDISY